MTSRRPRPQTVVTVLAATFMLLVILVVVAGAVPAIFGVVVAGFLVVLIVAGIPNTGILLLVLGFATAPMYKGIASSEGAVVTPPDMLLVLGILLLAPTLLVSRFRLPIAYKVGLMVLMVPAIVSSALASAFVRSFLDVVQLSFVIVILPIALAIFARREKIVDLLAWSYVAGHCVSVLYGFATGPAYGNRYQGLSNHPNEFAMAGLMSAALLLYLFNRGSGQLYRLVLAAAMVLSVASVVVSGSRGAVVVVGALIVMIPIVERSAVPTFVVSAAVAVGVIAIPFLIESGSAGSSLERLTGTADAVVADNARLSELSAGWNRFLEHPVIGSGFEGVELMHNVYLEVAVATGIIGLVGYVMVLYVFARPLFGADELRRLSYVAWAFIGMVPTVPGLEDRTLCVPFALAIVVAVRELPQRTAATSVGNARERASSSAPRSREVVVLCETTSTV
jgi:O-antigen ligase